MAKDECIPFHPFGQNRAEGTGTHGRGKVSGGNQPSESRDEPSRILTTTPASPAKPMSSHHENFFPKIADHLHSILHNKLTLQMSPLESTWFVFAIHLHCRRKHLTHCEKRRTERKNSHKSFGWKTLPNKSNGFNGLEEMIRA
jgi:hypothetical protein